MNAQLLTLVPSIASTHMAASTVSAWMALNSAPMTPPSASLHQVRHTHVCFVFHWLLIANSVLKHMFYFIFCLASVEVEPYLIFANRYYLRKLNLDGSNYTLIKQVRQISV